MGSVFQAWDGDLERDVAIKVMVAEDFDFALARFSREAKVLAGLRHPGIVRIFDSGAVAGTPYLVMELLEGRTLEDADGADLGEALVAVGEALDAVHAEGLVHRDIKPSNIFLTDTGRTVLMDFGLVLLGTAPRVTEEGLVLGTLPYLAPELLRGAPPTPATDWWAVGVTLYALAEGRYPCSAEDLLRLQACSALPPLTFELYDEDSRLARATRACLQLDPARRPRSSRDLRSLLMGTGPAPALRPGPGRDTSDAEAPRHVFSAATIAAPRRVAAPGHSRRAAPAVALLLACLVGYASVDRTGSGPPPRPDAVREELDRPPEEARASRPQGRPVAEELLAELDAAQLRFRDPEGHVRDLPEAGVPEGWRPLLDRDPLAWPETIAELPRLRAALEEVRAAPDGARVVSRDDLLQVDEAYGRQGLARPFHPFLQRPATAPVTCPARLCEPGESQVDGWVGTAAQAFLRAEAAAQDFEDLVAEAASGRHAASPLPISYLEALGAETNLRTFFTGLYGTSRRRRELAEALGPGSEALASLVVALGRATHARPAGALPLVVAASQRLRNRGSLWHGPWTFTGFSALVPRPPRSPAGRLLRGLFEERAATAHRNSQVQGWQRHRAAAIEAFLETARECRGARGPAVREAMSIGYAQAFTLLLDTHDPELFRRTWRQHRDAFLVDQEAYAGWGGLFLVLRGFLELEGSGTREDLEHLLGWIDRRPPPRDPTLRARLEAYQARLREALAGARGPSR
jgi:hypothetical protein